MIVAIVCVYKRLRVLIAAPVLLQSRSQFGRLRAAAQSCQNHRDVRYRGSGRRRDCVYCDWQRVSLQGLVVVI